MKSLELVFREELKKEYKKGFLHGAFYGMTLFAGFYFLFLRR
jgi:hypothetical protein